MAVTNTQKKVTEHFWLSVTRGNRTSKGNRRVTELLNFLLPCKPLFYNYFLPKGNRVTDKIQIIGYIYNRVKKGKIGRRASSKSKSQQNAFICYSVTSTAFRGVVV